MKAWVVRLLAALSIAASSGCANMAAIQEFGALSADATSYTKLTDEFASSPSRTKQYTFAAEADKRQEMDKLAKDREGKAKAAKLFHSTLSEYMAAVAALAADEAVSFDDEVGKLADAALKNKYIKESEANAVKSLGSIVVSAFADFYRQRKLKEVIEKGDAPLQVIVNAMKELVTQDYVASLDGEMRYARSYYRNLEQRARMDDKQSALAERIYAEGAGKLLEIEERTAAVKSYAKTLDEIGSAHRKLYEQRDKISDAEVQRQMKQYAKRIWAGYKASRGDAASDKSTADAAQ
jgi:prophage DNA circulation protein